MASPSGISNTQGISPDQALSVLAPHAKFKLRSFETSATTHVPHVLSLPAPDQPRIVLLGNSMFERMKTTGETPDGAPWPSLRILSEADMGGLKRFNGVFNAGVGGDKIGNCAYRLVGDEGRGLRGLLDVLRGREVSMWVVCCGTNDLHAKRGLRAVDLEALRVMVGVLCSLSRPTTKVLVLGISYRLDIPDELVDEANAGIRMMVEELGRPIFYGDMAREEWKGLLEDHVHLNRDGYKVWMAELARMMWEVYDNDTL